MATPLDHLTPQRNEPLSAASGPGLRSPVDTRPPNGRSNGRESRRRRRPGSRTGPRAHPPTWRAGCGLEAAPHGWVAGQGIPWRPLRYIWWACDEPGPAESDRGAAPVALCPHGGAASLSPRVVWPRGLRRSALESDAIADSPFIFQQGINNHTDERRASPTQIIRPTPTATPNLSGFCQFGLAQPINMSGCRRVVCVHLTRPTYL